MAPAEVRGAIARFRCCKNEDIEHFLRYNAEHYEASGVSTTYIYYDFDNSSVEGYFSLAHKALSLQNLSRTMRQRLAGNRDAEVTPFILLGQLGRYMVEDEHGNVLCGNISGTEMMNDVFAIISMSNNYIMNRRVLVECNKVDQDKLRSFYEGFGFHVLVEDEDQYALWLKLEA